MADWVTAVVPAAGRGVRMGTGVPKQFLTLGDIPLLVHALRTFEASLIISEIILVVPQDDCQYCRETIVPSHGLTKVSQVVAGGRRRQDSVLNGVQAAKSTTEILVIHDAVRPFVSSMMITQVVEAARQHGAAIVAIPMRDTVKQVNPDGVITHTLNRDELWLAQTPQAFRYELLLQAHQQGKADEVEATDDAFLVERLGRSVAIVQGSSDNIKVTRPEDLHMGQAILTAKRSASCP
ncbi:2-C-methyl-D-erythritol 4-phosphate cytidylyltransferase [Candidatus Nitronereus thalassa]|uniref:2-C-methyl-D-erythritol 4-phosphate cytidylyltransferase n=1 Tax=Candidatus Nitronereus thalassa TaxID=3020898 RepID=A0ABU3K4F7_9BACT|nr:2-C-methyl-D-erythritol 4-phosphate cytidylyltransferase [Candidatus Nitronereus thalassa]MDT7041259.1 2-C-methyl-D-erythritol 4-phosphate cytidylyltransferase [Candidatus Nitronereus thalassa]